MRVLVACEFSGVVRDAFLASGHDAWSCDLLPAERGNRHYQGDVRDVLELGWDLMIAHPPCTHLAVSGARHFAAKIASGAQQEALAFVRLLMEAPVQRIAVENPVSIISTMIRKPDQIIQPWQHGHAETKATCLWLKGLPKLAPTKVVEPEFARRLDGSLYLDKKGRRSSRLHFLPAGKDRAKIRSRTFNGIAAAMAAQWG